MSRTGFSTLLNNPFYTGIIHLRRTNEHFPGIHEPLVSKTLFDRVQKVLTGKFNARTQRHEFLFRRMLTCATCQYSLIGELQKGHVYYRCHTKVHPPTCIREEIVHAGVGQLLQSLHFSEQEREYFRVRLMTLRTEWTSRLDDEVHSIKLRLDQIKDRLNRLTDAYLDQALDKMMFEERKKSLLLEQKDTEENLVKLTRDGSRGSEKVEKFLELVGDPRLSHELALPEEKREMLNIVTSNRRVDGKKLDLTASLPFREIVNRFQNSSCAPERDIPRTWDRLLDILTKLITAGQLPELPPIFGLQRKHTENTIPRQE